MSAFERAWLFLKSGNSDEDDEAYGPPTKDYGNQLPDLFSDESHAETPPDFSVRDAELPDIFGAKGNMPALPKKDVVPKEKVSSQRPQQLNAPANTSGVPPIAPIGEGHQLAVLGHRNWGNMHDETYSREKLYEDMNIFDDKMQEWIEEHGMPSHIISGGFGGTDDLVQQWCEDNDVPNTVHSPNFRRDGKWSAIGMRNDRITDAATHHLLFTSPMGQATQDAWMKANGKGKPVHVHSISSPPDTPLKDGSAGEKDEQPHWYRDFIGDKGAKIMPEDDEKRLAVGDKDRLTAAMRRVHGRQYQGGRMRVQSARERENKTSSGTAEGFPLRAPFTSASSRHLPRDTRTEEEKMHDRLLDMANESGANIEMQPREGGGRSKEDQLEEIRERKRLSNEEATQERAMGNLPIGTRAINPMSDHHEEQMREDMAALQEGRESQKITRTAVPAHRGTRGGRSQNQEEELPDLFGGGDAESDEDEDINDPESNELAAQELQRRIAYNHGEPVRAKQSARLQQPLPLTDDDGMLIELKDPHWIDDLRFQKMLRGLSPIDAAFSIIKGYMYAAR